MKSPAEKTGMPDTFRLVARTVPALGMRRGRRGGGPALTLFIGRFDQAVTGVTMSCIRRDGGMSGCDVAIRRPI